jgi:hypothetical protein
LLSRNKNNVEQILSSVFVFDDDSQIEILEWVQIQAKKYAPITRTDLPHSCEIKYSRSISRRWVDSFILRDRADLIETKSTPQEKRDWKFPVLF